MWLRRCRCYRCFIKSSVSDGGQPETVTPAFTRLTRYTVSPHRIEHADPARSPGRLRSCDAPVVASSFSRAPRAFRSYVIRFAKSVISRDGTETETRGVVSRLPTPRSAADRRERVISSRTATAESRSVELLFVFRTACTPRACVSKVKHAAYNTPNRNRRSAFRTRAFIWFFLL